MKPNSMHHGKFVTIHYNVHSLICFEERIERLLAELGEQHWDLLIFSETWRDSRDEAFRTDDGHFWFGSGGTKGRCGVGFLLHSRWRHTFFQPISERCASLGVRINNHLQIHAIGVYMPHGGHSDSEVEAVYAKLDAECRNARAKGAKIIIGGDFNAQVGCRTEYDNVHILGDNPMPSRNNRGNMLLHWCELQQLALSNTFGCLSVDASWTYKNGKKRKQLDYILSDMALAKRMPSAAVLTCVDIGSDHRPVSHEFSCAPPKMRKKKKKCSKTWKPNAEYINAVAASLAEEGSVEGVSNKAASIQASLKNALPEVSPDCPTSSSIPSDTVLHSLIEERRQIVTNGSLSSQEKKEQRIVLGKQIQKHIRKRQAQLRTDHIARVLAEFRDLKQLASLTGKRANTSITEVTDCNGHPCRSKSEIAEVFAQFYEELYRSRCPNPPRQPAHRSPSDIAPFTLPELEAALKKMKAGKASDSEGIAAEMLKIDCVILRDRILDLLNDVLSSRAVPDDWRRSRLVVLFKKGDPKMPSNYRPIAILPLLYKLFSRMLCSRLEERIMSQQSIDQAAYRKGYSTDDHLLTLTLLLERSSEWNAEVWLALVDFEKAFDTVEHAALWAALLELGVDVAYIDLLKMVYSEQAATVSAGSESRAFNLGRGVKQGDPISPLLFLAIMEVLFRRLKARWNKLNARRSGAYFGIVIDSAEDPLSNLRFADDVILFASNPSDIAKMVADLSKEASKFGLNIHMGKTVVLSNRSSHRPASVKCGSAWVKVADPSDTERYLGRKVSITAFHETEFQNRMASAWGAFFKFKASLCNRHVPLKYRVKLFESCVTPCALYSCGTWTVTAEMQRKLITTRRKMIRWIVSVPRAPDEDWVDYIQRATHRSEELAARHGSIDWATVCRQRKWTLASKLRLVKMAAG